MADQPENPKIARLANLLDREKKALLSGDLGAITQLADKKEELLVQLGPLADTDTPKLAELRDKIQRNQVLLGNALEGIRDVAERIKTLRQVQRSLETYDRQGQRSVVSTVAGQRIEKRA